MVSPSPIRDASRFLSRLSEFTPAEWRAALAAAADTTPDPPTAELAAAIRWLGLPGRREAHMVLLEWLDAIATQLLAADAAHFAPVDAAAALQLAERATLALLVDDALDQRSLDRLYAPFAALVPLAALRAGKTEEGREKKGEGIE